MSRIQNLGTNKRLVRLYHNSELSTENDYILLTNAYVYFRLLFSHYDTACGADLPRG